MLFCHLGKVRAFARTVVFLLRAKSVRVRKSSCVSRLGMFRAIVSSAWGVVHSWFAGCLSEILDSWSMSRDRLGYEAKVHEDR